MHICYTCTQYDWRGGEMVVVMLMSALNDKPLTQHHILCYVLFSMVVSVLEFDTVKKFWGQFQQERWGRKKDFRGEKV